MYAVKKIGIITWHYYTNFGSALQSFAMYNALKSLGYDAVIINFQSPIYSSRNCVVKFAKVVLGNLPFFKYKFGRSEAFKKFLKKYTQQTQLYSSEVALKHNKFDFSTIIAGSDQIWAPNVFNPVYMINFVDANKVNKISYAASVGLNDIPKELIPEYRILLSDFSSIAVREQEGADLLKLKCGIEASVVLDPTLLVDLSVYKEMESYEFLPNNPQNYIFCYFLNEKHGYKERVIKYAKAKGKKLVGWSSNKQDALWMTFFYGMGPREFLYLIHHASCVITDSYHSTIFSLLYHTPFWTIQRFASTDPICQNSRIRQLDSYFNIQDRIIVSQDIPANDQPFDFDSFELKLRSLREISIDYLKKNLQ